MALHLCILRDVSFDSPVWACTLQRLSEFCKQQDQECKTVLSRVSLSLKCSAKHGLRGCLYRLLRGSRVEGQRLCSPLNLRQVYLKLDVWFETCGFCLLWAQSTPATHGCLEQPFCPLLEKKTSGTSCVLTRHAEQALHRTFQASKR